MPDRQAQYVPPSTRFISRLGRRSSRRIAMNPRTLRWAWAYSAVLVLSIAAAIAPRTDGAAIRFVSLSGLLLLAPISIFCVLALSIASLRGVAAPTFISMNIAAIGTLTLAWHEAPYGEDGFVFGVYLAITLLILVVSFVLAGHRVRHGRL